uniref:Uncharacterized protein n=1 Tax=Rhizophagus irregularis (strain DAOM 181602 / DAOM 197198 / MUCL 43194) TaxID=747089 RepID=U9SWB2_RHIID
MSDKNNRIYINRLKVVIFSNFQPCGTLWEVWNRKRNWKGAYPWIQHGYERKLCNQRKTLLKILTSIVSSSTVYRFYCPSACGNLIMTDKLLVWVQKKCNVGQDFADHQLRCDSFTQM